jgi:hypothetical protein
MTEKIGPVELLAIGFGPEAKFEGRIVGRTLQSRTTQDDPHISMVEGRSAATREVKKSP